MSNVDDILSSIYTGRFVAERARADHLARALSEVEDVVREMRPTEPVTIDRGNTADLADLEEMRDILDGADLRIARVEITSLEREIASWKTLVDELQGHIERGSGREHLLREQIAALTPGPWVRLGDVAPKQCEIVMMYAGVVGGAPWVQLISETTVQSMPVCYFWRRLPAGLLDVPAPTVAP